MKQVRFDPATSIRRLKLPLSSSNTGSAFWLTDEDYIRIRRGIRKDAREARKIVSEGGVIPTIDENDSTFRGIEHLQSREVLQRQIRAKDRAIEAVFREQERQANAGMAIDDGAMAKVYMAYSRQARRAAIVRAASDEAIVLADRTPTTTSTGTTYEQHLGVLLESLDIDSDRSQAPTVDSTDTATSEDAARSAPSRSAGGMHAPSAVNPLQQQQQDHQEGSATSDLRGTWLNHHDSLRLSGSISTKEGPSRCSTEGTDKVTRTA